MRVTIVTKKQNKNIDEILGLCLLKISSTTWVGNIPERVILTITNKIKDYEFTLIKHPSSGVEIIEFNKSKKNISIDKQKIMSKIIKRNDL